jgi:hypothetical protein
VLRSRNSLSILQDHSLYFRLGNELVVSPSTHFPKCGVHLKSFKSPSISWYLETISPQKVREGEQTKVARTVVCWNTHAFTHIASLRTFSSHALSTSSWSGTPEYKAPRAEEVAEGCSISTYVISSPTTNDGCCIEKKERFLFLPRLLVLPLGSLFQRSSFSMHHDARSAQPAANDQGTPLLTRESE